MNRRHFLSQIVPLGAGAMLASRTWSIAVLGAPEAKPLRFGVISDLHHLQFGKSEEARMKVFMDAVEASVPDFIIQCGDFCRPKNSEVIIDQWNRFGGPKYHVLGNHDMDVCDKLTIMQLWGMEKPYYSFDQSGWHFVVLDRNLLRNADGTWTDYAKGNWYRRETRDKTFSDKAQLDWLRGDLAGTTKPVVVFMHQPVFITDFPEEIGNAAEILGIFDEANFAAVKAGGAPRVAAVFMGHDHDDRYGERNGVHYFLLNSASYAYCSKGAFYYADPLFAFVTLDPAGRLKIEGRASKYRDNPPDDVRATFPTKISDHDVPL